MTPYFQDDVVTLLQWAPSILSPILGKPITDKIQ